MKTERAASASGACVSQRTERSFVTELLEGITSPGGRLKNWVCTFSCLKKHAYENITLIIFIVHVNHTEKPLH